MAAASSGVREGLIIASGALVLAIVLAWRQWVEHRDREEDLSAEDDRYCRQKDWRRFSGTGILMLIAGLMFRGLTINPKANLATGRQFVWIWTGVLVLVCVEMVLALMDWQANLAYARRHRRNLIEARRALVQEEQRLRASRPEAYEAGSNGHHDLVG